MNKHLNLNDLSMDELNKELVNACRNGDLELIKKLIESDKLHIHPDYFNSSYYDSGVSDLLLEMTMNEDLDIIQYLLTSTPLKDNQELEKYLNVILHIACWNDRFDAVKFVLSSPELSKHAEINSDDGDALKYACKMNNLHIVDYLLNSSDLKEKAVIQHTLWFYIGSDNLNLTKYLLDYVPDKEFSSALDFIFIYACGNGSLETVQFVLNSEELKEHADIYGNDNDGFRRALRDNHHDILQYLIFDCNIEQYKEIISESLLIPQCKHTALEVEKWFALREINSQLNQELICDNISKESKKVKL